MIGRITSEVGKMPREVWPVVAAHWSRPGFYAGMRSHIESIPDTVMEMQDAEPIREIPVTVLTPGKSKPLSSACLARIGDNVQQVIAPASEHWIHLDEPDLVIDRFRRWWPRLLPSLLQRRFRADREAMLVAYLHSRAEAQRILRAFPARLNS